MLFFDKNPLHNPFKTKGTALIVTLMVLLTITAQVMVLFIILNRGLGEESKLQSLNIEARNGIDTYMTKLESSLSNYLQSNSSGGVPGAYGLGSSPLENQTLQIIDPENVGAGLQNTEVTVDAYVSDATRPPYYRLTVNAKVGKVDLTEHKWVRINPCADGGTINTIISGVTKPGWERGTVMDTTGRVFFGGDAAGASLHTWHDSTGLSTIVSMDYIGANYATRIAPDGRVYYGAWGNPRTMWTWKDGDGLSALRTNIVNPLSIGTEFPDEVADDGRVYFANAGGSNQIWTWQDGSGLSTITTGINGALKTSTAVSANGRIFFGSNQNVPTTIYTWQDDGQGLSGLVSGYTRMGSQFAVAAADDGTGYFGAWANPSGFWRWKDGEGLSTIISGEENYGWSGVRIAPDERIFFAGGSVGNVFTWKNGSGLSYLISGRASAGSEGMAVTSDNRVIFGERIFSGNVWMWKDGEGLSALVSGYFRPGRVDNIYVASNDRVYFGQENTNPSYFWTWRDGSGLSVIASGQNLGNPYAAALGPYNGIVFGQDTASPSNLWMWSETTDLSVLTSSTNLGPERSLITDTTYNRVFFSDIGNFYYWQDENCSIR